jgi:hypothetical protein
MLSGRAMERYRVQAQIAAAECTFPQQHVFMYNVTCKLQAGTQQRGHAVQHTSDSGVQVSNSPRVTKAHGA